MRHVYVRDLAPKKEAYQFDGSIESYEAIRQWVENSRQLTEVFYRPENEDQKEAYLVIIAQKERHHMRPGDWLLWEEGRWQVHVQDGFDEWYVIVEEVEDHGGE